MRIGLVKAFKASLASLILLVGATVAVLTLAEPAVAWSSGDDYPEKWRTAAKDSVVDDWGHYNRECTSWVSWALHSRNGFGMPFHDNANMWGADAKSRGYSVNMSPSVGSVAWWTSPKGYHVAWVSGVKGDRVVIEEYNAIDADGDKEYDGTYGVRTIASNSVSGYIHFKDLDGSSGDNGGGSSAPPQIIQVKRTADPGGVRQVYAATKSTVTEGWWIPGGDGVHTHEVINIAQGDIAGFDKVNLPGGKQAVYTAVSNGVYEAWWDANHPPSSAKIVSGLSGVKGVVAYNTYEGGQFVHHLYVLASDGPYEVWWKDGGDGVHVSRLTIINGGVAFTHSVGPDGAMQLYVATPTWVYEVWWVPGTNQVHAGAIINIVQADIRSVSKGENLPDGGQLLYTGTSTTAWQSYWRGSSPAHGTIATGQSNAIQVQKTVTDGTHQLYLATNDADWPS